MQKESLCGNGDLRASSAESLGDSDTIKHMESNIVFITVVYIGLLNVCIGLYLGLLGADGLARPRPVALLIMLLATGAPFLLLYAQKTCGFKAEPKHILTSLVFFAIAYVAGRAFRTR